MASPEEIRMKMKRRFKTRADVDEFAREWGGGISKPQWTDAEMIEQNINAWVKKVVGDQAKRDELSMRLGLPTDAYQLRLDVNRVSCRAWVAIAISALALIISVIAIFR